MRKLCMDLARFVGSSALSLLESGLRKHCCLAIPDRRAFVQHYDSDVLDASLLLMPLCKFIAPTDPRWTPRSMPSPLSSFDAVAREAGCRGVVVVHHTGHDKSRARGASSFGDWPTAMWTLERDGDKPSQFRARGRDVYVERSGLVYDQNTRQLSKLVGPDDADAE
jgi:hypothetical protein